MSNRTGFSHKNQDKMEHDLTLTKMIRLFILAGLLTPKEGQVCYMTGGLLPDDIMDRLNKKLCDVKEES